MSKHDQKGGFVFVADASDQLCEETVQPTSPRLDRLIEEQEETNIKFADLPNTGNDIHAHEIAAIQDALALAVDRIGGGEQFTREQLLTAIGWAAHVGSLSTRSIDMFSPKVRRRASGNLADGRDNWAKKYPPIPLFNENTGGNDE